MFHNIFFKHYGYIFTYEHAVHSCMPCVHLDRSREIRVEIWRDRMLYLCGPRDRKYECRLSGWLEREGKGWMGGPINPNQFIESIPFGNIERGGRGRRGWGAEKANLAPFGRYSLLKAILCINIWGCLWFSWGGDFKCEVFFFNAINGQKPESPQYGSRTSSTILYYTTKSDLSRRPRSVYRPCRQ